MEQDIQHNPNESQVSQGESQAPKKSWARFYILGGIALVAVLVVGAFFLFGDLSKSAQASIILQTDQGTFREEAVVPASDSNRLVWSSANVESCQITSSLDGQTVEVSTNQEIEESRPSTQEVPTSEAVRTLPPMPLPDELPLSLKPGEKATYTLTCDGATDTITVTVRHYLLADFKKAENRWLERFDTSDIPTGSFKAFYFNSVEPNTVVKTEVVPKVAIDYAWSDGPGFKIDSKNFGGYWIGNIIIEQSGIYSIVATEGWSENRVIIDGYEIPVESEIKVDLEKGTHQVEVEFLNNWHTTEFLMTIEREKEVLTEGELRAYVDAENNTYDVWYVYGYDESPELDITQKADRPTIIFLESYAPTQWVINNAAQNNIAYIAYASFKPGATVESNLDDDRVLLVNGDVIPDPDSYGGAAVEARCWTDDYPPRCDNVYTISNLDKFAKEFSGGSLTGFTALTDADENLASISIPQVTLTASKIADILAKNEKIKSEAEVQAKKEAGTSIEEMFSD